MQESTLGSYFKSVSKNENSFAYINDCNNFNITATRPYKYNFDKKAFFIFILFVLLASFMIINLFWIKLSQQNDFIFSNLNKYQIHYKWKNKSNYFILQLQWKLRFWRVTHTFTLHLHSILITWKFSIVHQNLISFKIGIIKWAKLN